MTQVKVNPLPAGRYWLDVADFPVGKIDEWNAYVAANTAKLAVEHTEETDESGSTPRRLFTIFSVTAPLFFPQTNFGPPNLAPASVKSEADTEQVPDPEDSLDPTQKNIRTAIAVLEGLAFIFGLKTALDFVKTLRSKTP